MPKKPRVRKLMQNQHNKGMGKTASIWTAVILSYFLITLKKNQLQILFLRSIWRL